MRTADKLYNIIKSNLLSEQRYLQTKGLINEMNYERISQDDFSFLQKFPGWEAHQTGDSEFSIRNEKYPRISFDVSIADSSSFYGSNQKYPWAFEINVYGKNPYDPNKSGHQGHVTIEKSKTSNLAGTFKHFLDHSFRLNYPQD